MVGQGVLQCCLADDRIDRITLLSRRPQRDSLAVSSYDTAGGSTDRSRDQQRLVDEIVLPDFADANTLGERLSGIEAAFYCAGAPPVGTAEDTYRHVTVALTLAVARAYAAANPGGRFLYVSGANSDVGSRIMPLRVKGEAEQALLALPITTIMLRPGGILPASGTRSPHGLLRAMHAVAAPLQGPLLRCLPSLATRNDVIGGAMVALARMPSPPRVVENRDINQLGGEGR